MELSFNKMHGLGNDFVVIDGVSEPISLSPAQVRHLADRRFGVGCDQVLVAEPAINSEADFFFRIYNSDGSEAEQCGNGARCLALFLHRQGLSDKAEIRVDTITGPMTLALQPDGQVSVELGPPRLEPSDIPFLADTLAPSYRLDVDGQNIEIGAVSLGNPHAVLVVPSVDSAPVLELGPKIEAHRSFPQHVNVGFMEIVDQKHIRLRVFERGAGETLACGSGACAAVVVGQLQGLLKSEVTVSLPGGDLMVSWGAGGESVMMQGSATHVFEGRIQL